MDNRERIVYLVKLLNEACDAYYNLSKPIMDDNEFDKLYSELQSLEKETNIVLVNSPTQNVGYTVVSDLEEVRHDHLMLSLDKCHSIEELIEFASGEETINMLKMDGNTITLRYENGELVKAETRGNGEYGLNVLHNVMVFENVPKRINHKETFVIDGECIITYNDFEMINDSLSEEDKYKNARNLASGSVQLFDSEKARNRHLKFIAWRVIDGIDSNSFEERLLYAKELGFDIVPYRKAIKSDYLSNESFSNILKSLTNEAEQLNYPIDGVVSTYNNVQYGLSLGSSAKTPKHSIAYKFEDERFETKLLDIEWTMGATGVLTPNAITEPVVIDGTTVSRASLHNISIMNKLGLTKGCTVSIYKANMIIPQIDSCIMDGNENFVIPNKCPYCGAETIIEKENESESLFCSNNNCSGRLLFRLKRYVSRDAMDINGLSEATLEKFIYKGWITDFIDIYDLYTHDTEIAHLKGFGVQKTNNIIEAITMSMVTTLDRFLYAIGIPNVGVNTAKEIARICDYDINNFLCKLDEHFDFGCIDGLGDSVNDSIHSWFKNDIMKNYDTFCKFEDLISSLYFEPKEEAVEEKDNKLNDLVFVITGKLNKFDNREALVSFIENHGGKVSKGVTQKVDYLINNDIESKSSKNKKALELGIKIITEDDFLNLV